MKGPGRQTTTGRQSWGTGQSGNPSHCPEGLQDPVVRPRSETGRTPCSTRHPQARLPVVGEATEILFAQRQCCQVPEGPVGYSPQEPMAPDPSSPCLPRGPGKPPHHQVKNRTWLPHCGSPAWPLDVLVTASPILKRSPVTLLRKSRCCEQSSQLAHLSM